LLIFSTFQLQLSLLISFFVSLLLLLALSFLSLVSPIQALQGFSLAHTLYHLLHISFFLQHQPVILPLWQGIGGAGGVFFVSVISCASTS